MEEIVKYVGEGGDTYERGENVRGLYRVKFRIQRHGLVWSSSVQPLRGWKVVKKSCFETVDETCMVRNPPAKSEVTTWGEFWSIQDYSTDPPILHYGFKLDLNCIKILI